jgi:hypothetical protein
MMPLLSLLMLVSLCSLYWFLGTEEMCCAPKLDRKLHNQLPRHYRRYPLAASAWLLLGRTVPNPLPELTWRHLLLGLIGLVAALLAYDRLRAWISFQRYIAQPGDDTWLDM